MEHRRPEIHVCYSEGNKVFMQEVLAGIEEEGLFSSSYEVSEGDPINYAHKAAESSLLGVGISICQGQVVLHAHDLDKDNPLFIINTNDPSQRRIIGNNAARYIKGIPFK